MRVGERLRADLDPHQFDEFGVRMDRASTRWAMLEASAVRSVEAADAAGRDDRARSGTGWTDRAAGLRP
jgi:hypothetical protein